MTIQLAVLESYATATDSVVIDLIVRTGSTVGATDSLVLGYTPPLLTSVGVGVSEVFDDTFTLIVDAVHAVGTVIVAVAITGVLTSDGHGTSSTVVEHTQLVVDQADAAGFAHGLDIPMLVRETAHAVSSADVNTVSSTTVGSRAAATSRVFLGQTETVTTSAGATSTLWGYRTLNALEVATATAESSVEVFGLPASILVLSTASAVSEAVVQVVAQNLVVSTANAESGVWYKDPARIAWVMNTETTAVSWYDNFDFDSIAQTATKVFATGPDGLYVLDGGTDSGELIAAEVSSGFMDFGSTQTKRVDAMYFGYTSADQVSVTVETYESGHPAATYFLERRPAALPRNSRVMVGKGLYGRYWRLSIKNVAGTAFAVHSATIDIAVSQRRV